MDAMQIRNLRKQLKMNEVEFARLLNVDGRSVSNWEKGKTAPNASAVAIMRAFNELFDRSGVVPRIVNYISSKSEFGGLSYFLFSLMEDAF